VCINGQKLVKISVEQFFDFVITSSSQVLKKELPIPGLLKIISE
jgi:hypothetical protein